MAAVKEPSVQTRREQRPRRRELSLPHLALLVAALMALALIVVGVARDGSSPLFFVLPIFLVYVAIRGLRR